MTIDSSIVGTPLIENTVEVSWRHTTNFAAAVGDLNPRYLDDSREGGIVAPPLFAVAVTWPQSLNIRDYLEIEGFPWEVLSTQVHYFEYLRFHRPVSPGERLTVGGEVCAVLPRSSGTLFVIRYDARDHDGQVVFTEHTGAVLRGVQCTDDGASTDELPELTRPATDEAPLWTRSLTIDPAMPFIYDGCSDIVFPIHTSQAFARAVGLPGIILQGTATLALAAREILDHQADGEPQRLSDIGCLFTGMVLPGTSIQVRILERITSTDGCTVLFDVVDNSGLSVIRNGLARLA